MQPREIPRCRPAQKFRQPHGQRAAGARAQQIRIVLPRTSCWEACWSSFRGRRPRSSKRVPQPVAAAIYSVTYGSLRFTIDTLSLPCRPIGKTELRHRPESPAAPAPRSPAASRQLRAPGARQVVRRCRSSYTSPVEVRVRTPIARRRIGVQGKQEHDRGGARRPDRAPVACLLTCACITLGNVAAAGRLLVGR